MPNTVNSEVSHENQTSEEQLQGTFRGLRVAFHCHWCGLATELSNHFWLIISPKTPKTRIKSRNVSMPDILDLFFLFQVPPLVIEDGRDVSLRSWVKATSNFAAASAFSRSGGT